MRAKDFLYPRDLSVTPSGIKAVLLVGSCLAEGYLVHFKQYAPETTFEHIMFNNVGDLPDRPPMPIEDYDFQIIQLPLRYVVTDAVFRLGDFCDPVRNAEITQNAFNACRHMFEAAMRYNTEKGILTLVCNFVSPQTPVVNALAQVGTQFDFSALVRSLNAYLAELTALYRNTFVADIDSLASSMGKSTFLDDFISHHNHGAYWAPWHRLYDIDEAHNAVGRIENLPPLESLYEFKEVQMFEAVWALFEYMFRVSRQIDSVKMVVFDLDDTLWRGQIAEHYSDEGNWPVPHGWPFGLWEAVQNLRARGIITAVASKNTAEIVEARWDRAVQGKLVNLDDFLFKEINWRPKAENISKMIGQASLTPKSVVFVDDNPVERESVASAIPGIRVIGSNPYQTKRILLWSSETQILRVTEETVRREKMIQSQQHRENARASLSREEFLLALNARVTIETITSSDDAAFNRCFELLNKTNQFNTTGERWTQAELASFFAEGGRIYAFRVADKFTEYGLVGVILYDAGQFRQFAMSCRVLGLDVETSVISHIISKQSGADRSRSATLKNLWGLKKTNAPGEGPKTFSARVRETEANMVCRNVYAKCGFVEVPTADANWILSDATKVGIAVHLRLEEIT